jgi:replication initiation protein RepC
VPKGQAFVAVKRVAAHIGLKAGDMLLLDTLGAFTRAQDWEEGQRPIVWASNAYLMAQTGFSLSALKRHARRLAEIGVVSFKDSPNGKRWGHRDAEGRIIEAYGFDLSPLAAQTETFEALYAEVQAERALCQRLKRQITVARRMIRARIEAAVSGALRGPWGQLGDLFEELLARLPRGHAAAAALDRLLGQFTALQARVEAAFLAATQGREQGKAPVDNTGTTLKESGVLSHEMNPTGVISAPHIPITNQLTPVTCNSSENEETAAGASDPKPSAKAESKSGKQGSTVIDIRPSEAASEHPDRPDSADSALDKWAAEVRRSRTPLDLQTVLLACPEFASWARTLGGALRDWRDLHRVAGQLRPMIGVSEQAWAVAQDRLGKQLATAALAIVFEKHTDGEVTSPGGYLRGMVEKANAGELNLERSFYGRLNAKAA